MMDETKTEGLIQYEFVATFRKYKEDDVCGWNFLFMPKELAKEIRANFKWREEGWGRMKVTVKIGGSVWKTSIWFDTKHDTFLLPVKAEIRKKKNRNGSRKRSQDHNLDLRRHDNECKLFKRF